MTQSLVSLPFLKAVVQGVETPMKVNVGQILDYFSGDSHEGGAGFSNEQAGRHVVGVYCKESLELD